MNKTLFVSDKLEKIDLGDGFFVEVPEAISFADAEELYAGEDINNPQKIGRKMLFKMIKKWNITNEDGSEAEINEKNIGRLPLSIVNKIIEILTPKFVLSKKK